MNGLMEAKVGEIWAVQRSGRQQSSTPTERTSSEGVLTGETAPIGEKPGTFLGGHVNLRFVASRHAVRGREGRRVQIS